MRLLKITLLIIMLPLICLSAKGSQSQTDSGSVKVILLGTGTPNPTPERSGPALAIIVKNTSYIVDCGPGVVRRASEASRKGFPQLKPENLQHLFITHLHSDHTTGLPDFLLGPWVLGRDVPLNVFGPSGTADMLANITKAYQKDIDVRKSGLQPANDSGYIARVTEFAEGLVYADSNVKVYAYRVDHGDWQEAYCFRFETAEKVIVVSGDCRPCAGILKASENCDILIHEVYSNEKLPLRKPEWQKYHKAAHTSTLELGRLADKVKPRLLVLYHILDWGATPAELVKEINTEYRGAVKCGSDLDIIE